MSTIARSKPLWFGRVPLYLGLLRARQTCSTLDASQLIQFNETGISLEAV